jgi:formylglycine-generating enzyme required for sulfatase activity
MALAGGTCVDRWEAGLVDQSPYEVPTDGVAVAEADRVPQAYISGEVAAAACAAAGKRLCTSEEWLRACAGDEGHTWPYGDTYDPAACNDTYGGSHPVVDYFGTSDGVWDAEHLNDPGIDQQPGTVDAAGSNPGCVTPEGVFDLHGNLHEWVDDPAGTFRGGFYADASINGEGCAYVTTAHDVGYHDYSTGFRCCADPV